MNEEYTEFKKRRDPSLQFSWPAETKCPVMLLAMQPALRHESLPFGGGDNQVARVANFMGGVDDRHVSYNYFNKFPWGDFRDAFWRPIIISEINCFLQPRAVVLLGVDVMRAVIGGGLFDINEHRKTRMTFAACPGVNFFLTHSPADVVKSQESFGREFLSDLTAVYKTDHLYFNRESGL